MRISLILFALTLISSCGFVHDHEGYLPVEPSGLQTKVTTDLPQVVMVYNGGVCTGTIVADNLVLTAAHCDRGTEFNIFHHDGPLLGKTTTRHAPEKDDPDIAVLEFPTGTFKDSPLPLGFSVEKNDSVELVGFGCNDAESKLGQTIKRRGSNTVLDVFQFITLYTPLTQNGRLIVGSDNTSGICSGDSGGPLLKNGGIVGVGSISEVHSNKVYSWFVNLNLQAARDFLRPFLPGVP